MKEKLEMADKADKADGQALSWAVRDRGRMDLVERLEEAEVLYQLSLERVVEGDPEDACRTRPVDLRYVTAEEVPQVLADWARERKGHLERYLVLAHVLLVRPWAVVGLNEAEKLTKLPSMLLAVRGPDGLEEGEEG